MVKTLCMRLEGHGVFIKIAKLKHFTLLTTEIKFYHVSNLYDCVQKATLIKFDQVINLKTTMQYFINMNLYK